MTSSDSSSMSRRIAEFGHSSPKMCSLSASPVPTPRPKRPGIRVATVAAAWATIVGWMRIVGQVTAVWICSVDVTAARPPSTLQTNGELPCSSFHGWKWSEIQAFSNPACSAWGASSRMRGPESSSVEKKTPILAMADAVPTASSGGTASGGGSAPIGEGGGPPMPAVIVTRVPRPGASSSTVPRTRAPSQATVVSGTGRVMRISPTASRWRVSPGVGDLRPRRGG